MKNKYAKINVSVDCVIFGWNGEHLSVLFIEQKRAGENSNALPRLAIPGDLVFENEGLDDAANRILKELTNLEGIYLRQFEAFGNPSRVRELKDQDWLKANRDDPDAHVITVAYFSLVRKDLVQPEASSFASNTVWIEMHNIPDLAFDHNLIVEKALYRLQQNIEQKTIGFELLPKKFTLTQIQNLYEAILDRDLDKRNFRKSIKKLESIVPLNEKQVGVTHKPGQLFEYRPI